MKCPKCSLVTFDHLSKCPRCETSFGLKRRLTRRGADPNRVIRIARVGDDVAPGRLADATTASRLAAARSVTTTPAPEPLAPAPSLAELAATEMLDDVEVQAIPRDSTPPPERAAQDDPPHRVDDEPGDAQEIRARMISASRARRRQRPDPVTESVDPALPDWYEPDLEPSDESDPRLGESTARR